MTSSARRPRKYTRRSQPAADHLRRAAKSLTAVGSLASRSEKHAISRGCSTPERVRVTLWFLVPIQGHPVLRRSGSAFEPAVRIHNEVTLRTIYGGLPCMRARLSRFFVFCCQFVCSAGFATITHHLQPGFCRGPAGRSARPEIRNQPGQRERDHDARGAGFRHSPGSSGKHARQGAGAEFRADPISEGCLLNLYEGRPSSSKPAERTRW